MQLLKPFSPWCVVVLLLIEASETAFIICNNVHSLQRILCLCAAWHCKLSWTALLCIFTMTSQQSAKTTAGIT